VLEAIAHRLDFGKGHMQPQRFVCLRDGIREDWVLKLMGKSNGELAADWIGSALATHLDVPCPQPDIANVSAEALETAPTTIKEWAVPGPAFATKYIRAGDVDSWPQLSRMPIPSLAMLVALDTWLEVLDRRKPEGDWNLIIDSADGRPLVLDFGKSLTPCLYHILGTPDGIPLEGHPALIHLDVAPHLPDACLAIEGLAEEEVKAIVMSCPQEWISEQAKLCAIEFLLSRQARMYELCNAKRVEGSL
jgi:hypothetical protein